MRYRLQRHDGTDCSATMVPITVLRMVPIQRYRQNGAESYGHCGRIVRSFGPDRAVVPAGSCGQFSSFTSK